MQVQNIKNYQNNNNKINFEARYSSGNRNLLSKEVLELWDLGQKKVQAMAKDASTIKPSKLKHLGDDVFLYKQEDSLVRLSEDRLAVMGSNLQGTTVLEVAKKKGERKNLAGMGGIIFETPVERYKNFYIEDKPQVISQIEDFIKKYVPLFTSEK